MLGILKSSEGKPPLLPGVVVLYGFFGEFGFLPVELLPVGMVLLVTSRVVMLIAGLQEPLPRLRRVLTVDFLVGVRLCCRRPRM